jgi:hypothetical protein
MPSARVTLLAPPPRFELPAFVRQLVACFTWDAVVTPRSRRVEPNFAGARAEARVHAPARQAVAYAPRWG